MDPTRFDRLAMTAGEWVTRRSACRPGDERCYAFPNRLEVAEASGTPPARCRIGGTRRVIVANAGRNSWDVWLDVHTGEGRLGRRLD